MGKIWTRNYDNLITAIFGGSVSNTQELAAAPTHMTPLLKNVNGNYYTIDVRSTKSSASEALGAWMRVLNMYMNSSNVVYGSSASTSKPFGVVLGTGTTEVSKEDYKLASQLGTSNFTLANVVELALDWNEELHTYTVGAKITLTYKGTDDVTVSECGLFTFGGISVNNGAVLLYREVLENPITLSQNDNIEIEIKQTVMQLNYSDYPDA